MPIRRDSASHLLLLARGPARGLASPRRKELLANLGPLLLEEISREPNPDLALMNLAAFIASIGARTSFLSLLEQHPATRQVLLRLFASSQYLSGLFIRHPEMIDVLVRSDLARLRRSALELNQELAELLAHSPDLESRLDALRSFRHQEFLRIAIANLAGRPRVERHADGVDPARRNRAEQGLGFGPRRSLGAFSDRQRAAAVRDRDGPPGLGRDVLQLGPRPDFRLPRDRAGPRRPSAKRPRASCKS